MESAQTCGGLCGSVLEEKHARGSLSVRAIIKLWQPRFGSVAVFSLWVEWFERFRFSVPAVPLGRGFSVFRHSRTEKDDSGSALRFQETGPAVPVPLRFQEKPFRWFRFRVLIRLLGKTVFTGGCYHCSCLIGCVSLQFCDPRSPPNSPETSENFKDTHT